VIFGVYLVAGWVFEHETDTLGLLSPGGSPNVGVVGLAVLYILLRVTVRFAAPMVVALAVLHAIAAFSTRRPPPQGPSS
jgi:hypothetical protein